ncbi:L-asparaginase II [Thalassospira xiamenensis]|uniref:asparaginase n=1 Tax=Thalassospira xiamenensis TaxID=220697 RepID=UPI000DED4CF3|nr:asparaginase [Thalassospira xiamenensis]RCK35791.1 L-asparaginase II [Thalassospira xiamenensis]
MSANSANQIAANPILVEATRGGMVESFHRGRYVVMKADGTVVAEGGDIDALMYPRSAIKPLLAIPLVESGAADAFGLEDKHIALACSSHNGEEEHAKTVAAWLEKIGLSVDTLACAPHYSLSLNAAIKQASDHVKLSKAHNNCSGKHCGFLTTAQHLGDDPEGYIEEAHPVQQRLIRILEEMGDCDLSSTPRGIDGCGIPVIGMRLRDLGLAMARMADPSGLAPKRIEAIKRIRKGCAAAPFMVAGTGRFCTGIMEVCGEDALVKVGAEGVYCAAFPKQGLGVALKIDDGTQRGAEVAMGAILRQHGVIDDARAETLKQYLTPVLTNWAGKYAGDLRPAF